MKKRLLSIIWKSSYVFITLVLLLPFFKTPYNWIMVIINFFIPFAIIIYLLLLLIGYFFLRHNFKIYLLVSCLILIILFPRIFSFHFFKKQNENNKPIRVLSYNTSFFSNPGHWTSNYHSTIQNNEVILTLNWLYNRPTEIICFQEFYSDSKSEIFNVVQRFKEKDKYIALSTKQEESAIIQSGLAVISTYPIIHQKDLFQDKNGFNRGMMVDLLVGNDTIRVINLHLQSMRMAEIQQSGQGLNKILNTAKSALYSIKNSSEKRASQFQEVSKIIESSPYKVILCGDFNETATSPLLNKINNNLYNTFRESGNGFGFSTKLPFRIDHIFVSKKFKPISSKVFNDISSSFHYPLESEIII